MTNLLDADISLRHSPDKASGAIGSGEGACPCITLTGEEALLIPEHFTVTLKGHRGQIVARSATRSEKASATVTLHFTKLCSVEEGEAEESLTGEDESRESPIDNLFKKATEEAPEEE